MRGWRLLPCGVAALTLLGASPARACSGARARLNEDNAAKVGRAALCLVNRRRHRAGLRRVRFDKRLAAGAAAHSADMVEHQFMGHDGADGDTMLSRAQASGYLTGHERAAGLGEALGCGWGRRGTANGIVRQWMGSREHRVILLSARVRDGAVGAALGTPAGGDGATFTLDVGYTG